MKYYKLDSIGVGDMFIFASEILLSEEVEHSITFNLENVSRYKSDAQSYWEFSKEFMTRLLPNKSLTFVENQDYPAHYINNSEFLRTINKKSVSDHFKSVFTAERLPTENPYIVFSTKARYYSKGSFERIKGPLFEFINSLGISVVLLGEKEVEYNYEYTCWGSDNVYSTYPDAIKHIDPKLLIDMTVPKLGLTTPDFRTLFNDMSIAYNSRACINIGVGGFFCMSLPSGKMRAIYGDEGTSISVFSQMDDITRSIKEIYTFSSFEEFRKSVTNMCQGEG